MGSNNYFLVPILATANCVSLRKLLNFLEAQFLTGKTEVPYQRAAVKINEAMYTKYLMLCLVSGKILKLLAAVYIVITDPGP